LSARGGPVPNPGAYAVGRALGSEARSPASGRLGTLALLVDPAGGQLGDA
jgi:hypothetical protein